MKKLQQKLLYLRPIQKCEAKRSKLLLRIATREVNLMRKRWQTKKKKRMTFKETILALRFQDKPIKSEIRRSQRLPQLLAHN